TAVQVAELDRGRWRVEAAFAELAAAWRGEVAGLGYPRAALFAFAVALGAYNVLAAIKAGIRAAHGAAAEPGVSGYPVANEVAGASRGLLIALPAAGWAVTDSCRWCRCRTPVLGSVECELAGNTHCQPHSRSIPGYFRASASGKGTAHVRVDVPSGEMNPVRLGGIQSGSAVRPCARLGTRSDTSQRSTVVSSPPDTSVRPSAVKAIAWTPPRWPSSRRPSCPVATSPV